MRRPPLRGMTAVVIWEITDALVVEQKSGNGPATISASLAYVARDTTPWLLCWRREHECLAWPACG